MSSLMILIIAVVAIAVLWAITTYNRFVQLKALLQEAWSGIDVQLKRRYDLIPNLVETVKGYAAHERGVFEKVTQLRSQAMQAQGIEAKAEAEAQLTSALKSLFAVAENYPELKANENFLALQTQLSALESDIQLARRYYNGTTRNYNIMVRSFPSNMVAGLFGYTSAPYFEVSSQERETPNVQF